MYPQFKKFTLMKQTETITTDSTGNNVLLADSSLPRLFIEENQEFIIEGQIFTWYFFPSHIRCYRSGFLKISFLLSGATNSLLN